MRGATDFLHAPIHADDAPHPPGSARVLSNGNDPGRRRRTSLLACLALTPALSFAAPTVIEETAKISSPDPSFVLFPERVAVEGDTIIATGRRTLPPQDENDSLREYAAFLFMRQSSGEWTYVRTLAQTSCDTGEGAEDTCFAAVGIRNGVAVVSASVVHVFERAPDGNWVAAPTEAFSGPGDAAVGTGVVLTSETAGCRWDSSALRKNSAGVWTLGTGLPGAGFGGCDDWGVYGPDVDISAGNRIIVGSKHGSEARIYEPSSTTWTQTAAFGGDMRAEIVAIDDTRAVLSNLEGPVQVFSRSAGAWTPAGSIESPDSAQRGEPRSIAARDLVFVSFPGDSHRGGSVGVFQETSPGRYGQVARLVASDSAAERRLGEDVAAHISGSFARVVAASAGALYVFDLDNWGVTPAPLQENFEQGNAANWTPMAGSSFSVVSSSGTKVYRQSSLAGDAGSFVASIDWTNQGIEADVKPTAFNGANRWVGLAVRRTDANNYYYIALRQSNVLELKRIVNGAIVLLGSTQIPVVLNRTYRLRLEAVGTLLRTYVDGRLMLEAHDTALTHGHAGVRSYKARADYDNVIVSQNPHLTLLDHRTNRFLDWRWTMGPGTWRFVAVQPDSQRVVQQDVSGDARAVNQVDANDQIVQVRATATGYAVGTGSRWFGVMARYRDADNYYYVTVRRDNTISLRKLVNGAIQVLDSAALTVSTGTPYTLRLEAVGSSLRVYVNGRVLLEATDTSHASGKYGLVTYKTAATYDDFIAWEP